MAPSRALLRCTARCTMSSVLRPSPRLLSTACRISSPPSALHPGPLRYSTPIRIQVVAPARRRCYSQDANPPEPPDYLNEAELSIFNKIKAELEPVKLEVQDISGGCGSMYALEIESSKFKGLPVIKQHKLVNKVLAEEIKGWHGVQLRTKAV
ncbi:bola protein [Lophiotrema nucula]|uniref:Bola protein n=1 Tax=Lophiotrema nucula TaxID=690887 RepID=A0A6A5YJE2_9PLEO|nr:bola protein [Lophiotrema nucula]